MILTDKAAHGLDYKPIVRSILGVDEVALPDDDLRLDHNGIDASIAENDTTYELTSKNIAWADYAAGSAQMRYLAYACCYRLAFILFDTVHDMSLERQRIADMDIQRNLTVLAQLRDQIQGRWLYLLNLLECNVTPQPWLEILDGSSATEHTRPTGN